jgi:hypothetical protein
VLADLVGPLNLSLLIRGIDVSKADFGLLSLRPHRRGLRFPFV